MANAERPPRRRKTKNQEAEEYIRQKISETALREALEPLPKLEEVEEQFRAEFQPGDILEETMVQGMAMAMWRLKHVLRLQSLANITADEIMQYPGLISVLDRWERQRSMFTKSFDMNLRDLRMLRKKHSRAADPAGAAEFGQPGKRGRGAGKQPSQKNARRRPEQVRPLPSIEQFGEEDLPGVVDPVTGKKRPWIN